MVQKVGKSKPWFLIQKNHQFIFAALFEFLMSQIFHRKKLDDFSAANMTKITTNVKKGEVRLVEQRSFVLFVIIDNIDMVAWPAVVRLAPSTVSLSTRLWLNFSDISLT